MMIGSSGERATFSNIQLLRAIAAFMVVGHHLLTSLNHYIAHIGFEPEYGARGVDIFFVISGFIMATTTAARPASPGEFAMSRIVRVVPLYWLLTLLTVAIGATGFEIFAWKFNWESVLRGLMFAPDPAGMPPLFVGWTLNYEMMFYAIFTVCLLISGAKARAWAIVGAITALWAAGVAAGQGSYLRLMGDAVILEFALGVILWMITTRFTASKAASWFMIAAGFAGLALPDMIALPEWPVLTPERLIVAGCAFGILFGAVSLEARGASVKNRLVLAQGDASYSTYLTHPFILQAAGKLAIATGIVATTAGVAATVAAMVVGVAMTGVGFHKLVELPLTRALKRWATSRPSPSWRTQPSR
jgi:exopolysaccharide production protein ExoZ